MSDAVEPIKLPSLPATVQLGDAAVFDEPKTRRVDVRKHLSQEFSFKLSVNDHDNRLVTAVKRVDNPADHRPCTRLMLWFGFAVLTNPPSIIIDGGIGNTVNVGKVTNDFFVS
jgi:hypothetical protein